MIFIPFEIFTRGIGGPSTFMRDFRDYLIKESYQFIEDINLYKEADSIFFPISFSRNILDFFKKRKKPIIQRLDGVFYPSKHGMKYILLNWEIKKDYLNYSDFIIFQSNFSKLECFTIMGEIPQEKYKIIYNGTDKSIFKPSLKVFNENKIIFATTGAFRNIDMIEPVVLALDEINKNYDIELRIIGPIINKEINKFTCRSYIKYLGAKNKIQLGEELGKIDILIHCQLNPACPNSVIEAISCGVPVVGFDTGAMKEIVNFAPELLACVSNEIFQKYKDFKYNKLLEKIVLCIENYKKYKKIFLNNSYLYNSDNCFKEYLKIFDSLN